MVGNGKVNKRQFKHFLIKKKVQLKFALVISLILLVMLVFFQIQTYFTLKSIMIYKLTEVAAVKIRFFQIIFGLIYILIIALFSITISHKIAGPIYRLEKDVKELGIDGDLTRVFGLRKRDEMQELAEALNIMVSSLRMKYIDSAKEKGEELKKLEEIAEGLSKEGISQDEKNKKIEMFRNIVKNISKIDEKFFKV